MATNRTSKQTGHPGGKIFVSYRRDDAADVAGRIRDWLVQVGRIPQGNVFMDVTAILPGQDFMQVIDQAISQCHAMLLVISPSWLAQVNSSPTAYVRLEAEAALRHKLLVIPILAGGAKLPPTDELPESLRLLKALNARAVRPEDFDYDMQVVGRSLGVKRARGTRGWLVAASALALVAVGLGTLSQGPADPSNPVWSTFHPATATPTYTPSPSPTPIPNNPYNVQNATPIIMDDPLVDNSQGNQWAADTSTSPSPPAACVFESTGIHCLAAPGYEISSGPGSPSVASLHNVIFEVKVSFAQSHIVDPRQFYDRSIYYLVVRGANSSGYSAAFTPDGQYQLHADASGAAHILAQGAVSNFQSGDGLLNTIALVIQDTTVSLYVNFQLVTRVTDETLGGAGAVFFGVQGGPSTAPRTDVTEVVFSHARVWVLP